MLRWDLDRASNGIHDARELRQHTVAHEFDDPPMVLSDLGIDVIGTQGLLRQYFPKGTDLSVYSQTQLNKVARQLNERPRKALAFETQ